MSCYKCGAYGHFASECKLRISQSNSGYRTFVDPKTGHREYTHRRVAQKKIGRSLEIGEHVHHINKDKSDNRPENLTVVKANVHREIHRSPYHEKHVCFRCGRASHWAEDCYATRDVDGNEL